MSKLLLKYKDRSFIRSFIVYQVGEGGLVGLERGYEKNVALKVGFRRKKILGLMGRHPK